MLHYDRILAFEFLTSRHVQVNPIKHPASLKVFFATEMWERYGFYVVQTLLALYLVMYFNWDDHHVYPLVGAFTALTYLSPVIGGWIADQLLGQKLSIIIGTLVLGYSYYALGDLTSTHNLMISLAGVAVGTGLIKPNISSLLGNEYPITSPIRERGFTIFYMGITSGIILGTTLPSYIQSTFGWFAAFQSASIGMMLALSVFVYGIYRYKICDYSSFEHNFKDIILAIFLIGLMWFGAYYVLHRDDLADTLFSAIGLISLIYMISTITQETGVQARQTLIIGLLCLISIIFWSFYFQMFLSLTLLIKRVVQPTLLGVPFPPPYYVAVQSLGMIIFGLFFSRSKKKLSMTEYTRRIGNKFFASILTMVFAYVLITLVCRFDTSLTLLSPFLFIPIYLSISIAELLLSPVGLSAITLLSSHKKVSTMMGIFFVSLGLGGFLSGKLASITAIPRSKLDQMSTSILKAHYAATFTHLLYILLIATFFCFIINRLIHHLMRSLHDDA